MAQGSTIEWTNHTWNPWWGYWKIAPECRICYAARFAGRGLHAIHIGVARNGDWTGIVTRSTKAVWQEPFKLRNGLVFTCSMSDFWWEVVPLAWLDEALDVIERTPRLTYQILTKRPGNIARRLTALNRTLPANIWLGATIGHPKSIPLLKPLLRLDAPNLRFLSCEPLLDDLSALPLDGIDWVIGGGESGPGATICNPDWMRRLRDKCIAAGVPFFLKQWGTWESNPTPRHLELDLQAKGGAILDGRLWREFPASHA